jgi:hypothetical protein
MHQIKGTNMNKLPSGLILMYDRRHTICGGAVMKKSLAEMSQMRQKMK